MVSHTLAVQSRSHVKLCPHIRGYLAWDRLGDTEHVTSVSSARHVRPQGTITDMKIYRQVVLKAKFAIQGRGRVHATAHHG